MENVHKPSAFLESAYKAYNNPFLRAKYVLSTIITQDHRKCQAMLQMHMAFREERKYRTLELLNYVLKNFSDPRISPKHYEYAQKALLGIKNHDFGKLIPALRQMENAMYSMQCKYPGKELARDLNPKLETLDVLLWQVKKDRDIWDILEKELDIKRS